MIALDFETHIIADLKKELAEVRKTKKNKQSSPRSDTDDAEEAAINPDVPPDEATNDDYIQENDNDDDDNEVEMVGPRTFTGIRNAILEKFKSLAGMYFYGQTYLVLTAASYSSIFGDQTGNNDAMVLAPRPPLLWRCLHDWIPAGAFPW